jgi:Family of unknown function (DUF6982)
MAAKGPRVVAHLLDGTLIRGHTSDFRPGRPTFTVLTSPENETVHVSVSDLKAVFFVNSLTGNPKHVQANEFDEGAGQVGRRAWVVFRDGEELAGRVLSVRPENGGFFLFPVDPTSNLERAWVVTANAKSVRFGDEASRAARSYDSPQREPAVEPIPSDQWDDMLRLKDIATPQKWRKPRPVGERPRESSDLFLGDW